MPQRKQLTWTELRVGIFVLVGLFLVAVGVLYVTGAGTLAPKYHLKTYLSEVEGLTSGATVRLDGVDIGNVDAIRIAPRTTPSLDPKRNIELTLRLNKKYQDDIRTDSTARLITEGLLGNRYVSIHRGLTGRPLREGEEIPGQEEKAIKQIVERGADVAENLNVMSQQVQEIVEGIKKGQGSLGKLLVDEEAYRRLNNTLGRLDRMVARVEAGEGSLGKLVASDELYQRVYSAANRFDTALADVQAQKGTLGKLVYDPVIHQKATEFLDHGNALVSDVRAGKGSFGKLVTDEALYSKWREVGSNLASATAKLNANTTTAGKFFTDPQFYDNLSGLAGDLRLLIGEFRQNPKQFLRVKFSVF